MYQKNFNSLLPIMFIILFGHNAKCLSREDIVGGYLATEENFLGYQVFIRAKTNFFDNKILPICGGAIIHDFFILSGARCFINATGHFKDRIYHIVAGTLDLNDAGGIAINVDSIYTLESFVWETYANDIAVLKLAMALSVYRHLNIYKIGLFKSDEIYIGQTKAIISGYGYNWVKPIVNLEGKTEYLGSSDNKLRYAHIQLITNHECSKKTNSTVLQEHLCGEIVTKNRKQMWGVCIGDGGSPLAYTNKIIGILSAIEMTCVNTEYPAKYTRVYPYIDFIESIMNDSRPANTRVYVNPVFYDRNVVLY